MVAARNNQKAQQIRSQLAAEDPGLLVGRLLHVLQQAEGTRQDSAPQGRDMLK